MDPDTMKAIALAKMEKDPEAKKFADSLGVSLEEAAVVLLRLKKPVEQRPERPLTPRPATPPPAPTITGTRMGKGGKMTRPDAILRVLKEVGMPMTRQDVYRTAVERGYIEPIEDVNKHFGIAVMRLLKDKKVEQMGSTKPYRIGLPGQRETEDPSKYF